MGYVVNGSDSPGNQSCIIYGLLAIVEGALREGGRT